MSEKGRTAPDTPLVPSIPTDPGRAVPFNRALTEPSTRAAPIDATAGDGAAGPDPVAATLAAASRRATPGSLTAARQAATMTA